MKRPTLKSSAQFAHAYLHGRKRSCTALVLFHLESAPDQRVAFVASRKVGGAVARNRAKRVMRVAFRQVEASHPDVSGWLIMIARRDILRLKSDQVAEQLRNLLSGPKTADTTQDRSLA